MNPIWPHRGFRELGDIAMDPEHVVHHSGVYAREVRKSTAYAPADDTHLDPGAVPPAYQGAPGVTLWEKAGISIPGITCGQDGWVPVSWAKKGQGREDRSGCHLARVSALHPSTEHVIFDDPGVAVQGGIDPVLPLTVTVFHNRDCHFPQVVGWWQWHCGEKPIRTNAGGFCLFPPVLTLDMRSSQYPLLFSMRPQPATQQVFLEEILWEAAGRETG